MSNDTEPIRKMSVIIPVSEEVLNPKPLTPAQRAEYETRRAQEDAYKARLSDTMAVAPEPLRRIAELHKQTREEWDPGPVCRGCDVDGYEWEHPEWPCRTATLLGEILGVEAMAE